MDNDNLNKKSKSFLEKILGTISKKYVLPVSFLATLGLSSGCSIVEQKEQKSKKEKSPIFLNKDNKDLYSDKFKSDDPYLTITDIVEKVYKKNFGKKFKFKQGNKSYTVPNFLISKLKDMTKAEAKDLDGRKYFLELKWGNNHYTVTETDAPNTQIYQGSYKHGKKKVLGTYSKLNTFNLVKKIVDEKAKDGKSKILDNYFQQQSLSYFKDINNEFFKNKKKVKNNILFTKMDEQYKLIFENDAFTVKGANDVYSLNIKNNNLIIGTDSVYLDKSKFDSLVKNVKKLFKYKEVKDETKLENKPDPKPDNVENKLEKVENKPEKIENKPEKVENKNGNNKTDNKTDGNENINQFLNTYDSIQKLRAGFKINKWYDFVYNLKDISDVIDHDPRRNIDKLILGNGDIYSLDREKLTLKKGKDTLNLTFEELVKFDRIKSQYLNNNTSKERDTILSVDYVLKGIYDIIQKSKLESGDTLKTQDGKEYVWVKDKENYKFGIMEKKSDAGIGYKTIFEIINNKVIIDGKKLDFDSKIIKSFEELFKEEKYVIIKPSKSQKDQRGSLDPVYDKKRSIKHVQRGIERNNSTIIDLEQRIAKGKSIRLKFGYDTPSYLDQNDDFNEGISTRPKIQISTLWDLNGTRLSLFANHNQDYQLISKEILGDNTIESINYQEFTSLALRLLSPIRLFKSNGSKLFLNNIDLSLIYSHILSDDFTRDVNYTTEEQFGITIDTFSNIKGIGRLERDRILLDVATKIDAWDKIYAGLKTDFTTFRESAIARGYVRTTIGNTDMEDYPTSITSRTGKEINISMHTLYEAANNIAYLELGLKHFAYDDGTNTNYSVFGKANYDVITNKLALGGEIKFNGDDSLEAKLRFMTSPFGLSNKAKNAYREYVQKALMDAKYGDALFSKFERIENERQNFLDLLTNVQKLKDYVGFGGGPLVVMGNYESGDQYKNNRLSLRVGIPVGYVNFNGDKYLTCWMYGEGATNLKEKVLGQPDTIGGGILVAMKYNKNTSMGIDIYANQNHGLDASGNFVQKPNAGFQFFVNILK